MNGAFINKHCAIKRGATLDTPFGPDTLVWKVGGKMFAAYAVDGPGVSVRCRDAHSAALLIELGKASQAPYLRDAEWVMLPWSMAAAEIEERLETSYRTVRDELSASARLRIDQPG